jgi:hypothetical protein
MLPGLLAAAVLAIGSPVRAEWLRAESDHFVVYGRSEKSVRDYASMLEDFDSLLRRLHGRPKDEVTPRKLPIYLVSSIGQLRRVLPNAKDGMAGVYLSSVPEVFVVAIRDGAGEGDLNKGDDTVLTPLAGNPHGGGEAEAAQAMLKSIEAKKADDDKT